MEEFKVILPPDDEGVFKFIGAGTSRSIRFMATSPRDLMIEFEAASRMD
jgi:hypothetical protein